MHTVDASGNPNIPVNGITGLQTLQMAQFAPIKFKERFKTDYFVQNEKDALAACQEIQRRSSTDMCAMIYLDAKGQLIGYDMQPSLVDDPLKVIRHTIRSMIFRALMVDADQIIFAFYHASGEVTATPEEIDLICNIEQACWSGFLTLHSVWCIAVDGQWGLIER